jgi:hypothetical protein
MNQMLKRYYDRNGVQSVGAGDRGYAVPTVDIHTHKHGHSMTQTVGTAC